MRRIQKNCPFVNTLAPTSHTSRGLELITIDKEILKGNMGPRRVLVCNTKDGDRFISGQAIATYNPSTIAKKNLHVPKVTFESGDKVPLSAMLRFQSAASNNKACSSIAHQSCVQSSKKPLPVIAMKGNGNILYQVKSGTEDYVVKVLSMNSTSERSILREMQLAPRLDHPNLAKVLGGTEVGSKPVIVMESVDGLNGFEYTMKWHHIFKPKDLDREGIDKGDTSSLKALNTTIHRLAHLRNIIKELASALQYLQSKKMMYRDLKLENIMISGGNWSDLDQESGSITCKLIDFGMLRELDEVDDDIHAVKGRKRSHSLCGTPGWLAPEVLTGAVEISQLKTEKEKDDFQSKVRYDNAVDNFGLGAVLYALLFGKSHKSQLDSNLKLVPKHFQCPWYVPIELQTILNQLLEIDPTKRMEIDEMLALPFFTGSFEEFKVAMDIELRARANYS